MATSEGEFYVGNIDPRDGGECRISKEFKLLSRPGELLPSSKVLLQPDDATAHVRRFYFRMVIL